MPRNELSKAARNERRKLKATYWNNVAVGLTITGYFAPAFSLCLSDNFGLIPLKQIMEKGLSDDQMYRVALVICISMTSLIAAQIIKGLSGRFINRLED